MSEPVFFRSAFNLTAGEVAALTGAELRDPDKSGAPIDRIAALEDGGATAVVFIESSRHLSRLARLSASAIFCTEMMADKVPAGIARLVTKRPQQAFAAIGRTLYREAAFPGPTTLERGLSPQACIDPSARLEDGVVVEAGAVIAADAAIGRGTVVGPNAVIGRACQIGRDCSIGPGAVVQFSLIGNRVILHAGAKIGQEGFGFVPGAKGPERMPQIGRVILQDNVEIGANTTIDRGALGDTIVGENTKIDNQVQVAHNVRIGRNCLIAGRVGISGSCTIGDGVMLGGGVGLADHLTIGDGAQLAAGSGLMHDIPAREVWGGVPAKPIGQTLREIATLSRLAKQRPGSSTIHE